MHFIRRRPDRSTARVLAATCLLAGGALASCSSSDGEGPESTPSVDGDPAERSTGDAGGDREVSREAGAVDTKPLPITCSSAPCAKALVTTLGATVDDRGEGFCALLDDGTVACWGANGAGQLGRGDEVGALDSAHPARVTGLAGVVTLDHTCAIDRAGAVWCWGTGPFLRSDAGPVTTERTPVKLHLPPAAKVGVSYSTACAASSDGIRCWGSNADGQLASAPAAGQGGEPPSVMPVPASPPVLALAVGKAVFVLREDGILLTWGGNPPIGRLSPIFPDPYPQRADLAEVDSADLAYDDACAAAGGTAYCWGSPLPGGRWGSPAFPVSRALPEPVVTPEPVVQIATTRTYVIEGIGLERYRWCASTVSGAVYCWGLNESGQAGDGTLDYAFDAVKVQGLPERAAQVKTTPHTTCALLTSGKVYCWGSNYNGQLGHGENRGRSVAPVEVMLP